MRDLFTFQRQLFWSTIRLSTPLILAALGGMFSERSGVINIALEGMMLAGAFTAASVTWAVGNPWLGLLAGAAAGLCHCVDSRGGVHSLQGRSGGHGHRDQHPDDRHPGLSERRAVSLVRLDAADSQRASDSVDAHRDGLRRGAAVTWYALYRTPFGLRLRSVGENPEAADAAGVNVAKVRYSGVLLSGVLAGIGGAYLSIGQSSLFTRNMTSGRGFIALAALIFGKWRPVQTMLACLFFGFTEAVTIQMQGVVKLPSGEDIPVQFIQMVPYVLTIVVLAGFIGHSRPPRALGRPYEKER